MSSKLTSGFLVWGLVWALGPWLDAAGPPPFLGHDLEVLEQDLEELERKANQGDAESQLQLGVLLADSEEPDYEAAFKWFQKAADQGNKEAWYRVGWQSFYGEGVEEDDSAAYAAFEKASTGDIPDAWFHFGFCLLFGYGVEVDEVQAVPWLRKAAEAQNTRAEFEYGRCLFFGTGMEKDVKAAREFFERAAQKDHADSLYFLARYQLEENSEEGMATLEDAADKGSGFACDYLGFIYMNGDFEVEVDREQAQQYFVAAVRRNYPRSIGNLRYYFPGENLDLVGNSLDLTLAFDVGVPELVAIETTGKGAYEIEVDGNKQIQELDLSGRLKVVEEVLQVGDEWRVQRDYLRSQITVNGEPNDDELAGVSMVFGYWEGTDRIDILHDVMVRKTKVNSLLGQVAGAGIDVGLPSDAQVGSSFEADFRSVLAFLFDMQGALEDQMTTFKFVSFSPEDKVAKLEATGELFSRDNIDGIEARISYAYTLVLEVDLSIRRVTSIKGTYESVLSSADGSERLRGSIAGDVALIASRQGVDKAREAKPEFRQVKRRTKYGVAFEIPSNYFEWNNEKEIQFGSTNPTAERAFFGIAVFSIDETGKEKAIDDAVKAILEQAPNGRVNKVKSALGVGQSISFENTGLQFRVDVYLLDDQRILRVRHFGPLNALMASQAELKHLLATLEIFEPK